MVHGVPHGGSYPGYQTQTMLHPEGKVAAIVLTNADAANPGGIATQLLNTVGEAVAKAAAPKPAPASTTASSSSRRERRTSTTRSGSSPSATAGSAALPRRRTGGRDRPLRGRDGRDTRIYTGDGYVERDAAAGLGAERSDCEKRAIHAVERVLYAGMVVMSPADSSS